MHVKGHGDGTSEQDEEGGTGRSRGQDTCLLERSWPPFRSYTFANSLHSLCPRRPSLLPFVRSFFPAPLLRSPLRLPHAFFLSRRCFSFLAVLRPSRRTSTCLRCPLCDRSSLRDTAPRQDIVIHEVPGGFAPSHVYFIYRRVVSPRPIENSELLGSAGFHRRVSTRRRERRGRPMLADDNGRLVLAVL